MLHLARPAGKRTLPLADFSLGYRRTALADGEVIAAIALPKPGVGKLLLLAISVWLALRDAVAGIADYRHLPKLDAPATPEAILTAIEELRVRDQATSNSPASA